MEESFENYEVEQSKRIVKTFKLISLIIYIIEGGLILLFHFNIWTSRKLLILFMVLLPWIRYIYALRCSDIAYWDEANKRRDDYEEKSSKEWLSTHVTFIYNSAFVLPTLIYLYVFNTLLVFAHVHKGESVIYLFCVVAFLVMLIIGYLRVGRGFEDRKRQLFYYFFIMLFVVGLTVSAVCYSLSSPVAYEECTYISKSTSHSRKGGTSYYVEVRLQDGSSLRSEVTKDLYHNAQYEDLYLCREENPFGIEYWHVCVGK